MMRRAGFTGLTLLLLALRANAALPVGALVHDGPATPEQISLFLPVTGSLPQTATASVRYKASSSSTWMTGHPLYRIQPAFSDVPETGSVPDAFAWPIIGLTPVTAYDVEVTVASGGTTDIQTAAFTTRALPAPSGPANKTITAGSSAVVIQTAFNNLNPGDVIEFEDGTYTVDTLQLKRSGTPANPITIRGQSRTGVVLSDPTGIVLQILDASNVNLENVTLQGSGVDSGTASSSIGISFYSGTPNQTRITVRNVTIRGVDMGIRAWANISEFLAYDNTLLGNNVWTVAMIDTNLTWNDDGMNVAGFGNCAFNNTLRGFGDSFSYASQHTTQAIGVHYYRNEVLTSGDDAVEVDAGHRNITFYDNRVRNSMTFISLDPLYGGPFLAARNISINTGRQPFKWNNTNSGQFIYNNTIVRTTGQQWVLGTPTAEAGWIQHDNGEQKAYGYQNNLLVYRGAGNQTIRIDCGGHDPVDFTHNAWFPDAVFQWPQGRFTNLAAAYSGLTATTPVFSGITKRHEQDVITTSNPWTDQVTLGTDYRTEVTVGYTPVLATGTTPKNSGLVIPNITDGYSGAAPDRGALIEGRAIPQYGDRTGTIIPPPPPSGNPPPPTCDASAPLPAPDFLSGTFPLNSTIGFSYPSCYTISTVNWTITQTVGSAASALRTKSLAIGQTSSFPTSSPQFTPAAQGLSLGTYQIQATVTDNLGRISPPSAIATITLVNADLSSVRVYPNPWRADKHVGHNMIFDGLTVGTTIKIFMVSGHEVKELRTDAASTPWDLTNDSGDKVASGVYVYLISDGQGNKVRGKVAVIK